jgi:hypothetical protein
MKHLLLPGLLIAVFLVSCKQPTETTLNGGDSASRGGGVTPGAWTIPGAGTMYVFETTQQSITLEFDTITIVKSGINSFEEKNVVSYIVSSEGEIDSEFYGIGTNGNFAFGDGEDSLGVEVFDPSETYPTGTQQPILLEPSLDSIEGNERIVQSDNISFVGVENLSLPAGTFSTLHTREANINDEFLVEDSETILSIDSEFVDIWFAPSTGFYVKWTENTSENGVQSDSSGGELIKFTPH